MLTKGLVFWLTILMSKSVLAISIPQEYLKKQTQFRPPSDAELAEAMKSFSSIFEQVQGSEDGRKEAEQKLRAIGFDVNYLEDNTVLIASSLQSKLGWGIYLIKVDRPGTVMIQVPHRFHDKKSLDIGLKYFADSRVNVISINQVPRYTNQHSDFAHHTENFFIPMAKAYQQATEQSSILQIHGFSQTKRRTLPGKKSNIILSDSTKFPQPYIFTTRDCLQQYHPWRIRIFPNEVVELGGTKNTIFRELERTDAHRLYHIEINYELRTKLAATDVTDERFLSCFLTQTKQSRD